MQTETMPYQWFVERYFSELEPVRDFGLWQVWSAQQYRLYLLLVVNEIEEIVVKCQYGSLEERTEEIKLLRRLPPEGGAGEGIFASLNPAPPVLSTGNAW